MSYLVVVVVLVD